MTLRPIFAAAALLLLSVSPALAFDTPPPVDAPEITSFSSASGWYIRGDLGYNASVDFDKPTVRSFKPALNEYTRTTFDSARFDGDYSLNAGVGYQFNDWLRTDATIDYFKGTFNGKSVTATRCSGLQPSATKCGSSYEQSMASLGLLANGYVDLGTYMGLTPYVGAGVGATNVDYGPMRTSRYCVDGGSKCNKFADYKDARFEGAESWRFTYALMAGLSYDVATNMKLDVGYRYSDVQGGDMFDWRSADRSKGATGIKGEDNGFSRHEVRVGLRMTGW